MHPRNLRSGSWNICIPRVGVAVVEEVEAALGKEAEATSAQGMEGVAALQVATKAVAAVSVAVEAVVHLAA